MNVFLYTDGACRSNGLGGWACIAIQEGSELWRISGQVNETTNNRMELMAILQGMARIVQHGFDNVIVITDSKYSRDAIMRKWGDNPEIKNSDLIKQIKSLVGTRRCCKIEWVKGHSGVAGNELADRLAVAARDGKTLA